MIPDRAPRRPDRIPEPPARSAQDTVSSIHLANVLAHRLGSLVSGIVGYTDLLMEDLGEPGQRDLAMRILESAQRIEHVLTDLSHYTRPISPEAEPVSVGQIAGDALRVLPDEVAERVVLDLAAVAGRRAIADPYLSRDVLTFLLHNAAEAAPRPASIVLRAATAADGRTLWFDVENDARPDAETLARLFEPFYTTKARNLGVGLPMARRYARAQLGDVVLVSDGSEGPLVVRFSLPAARMG